MGRQADPTYSSEQRGAIAQAVNDEKVAVPEVIKRAAAGTLSPGLPAFEISYSTAYSIATQERPGLDKITASPRMADLANRVLTVCEEQVELVEKRAKTRWNTGLEYKDLTRLANVGKVMERLANVDRLMKTASPGMAGKSKKDNEPLGPMQATSPLMKEMQEDMEKPDGAGP